MKIGLVLERSEIELSTLVILLVRRGERRTQTFIFLGIFNFLKSALLHVILLSCRRTRPNSTRDKQSSKNDTGFILMQRKNNDAYQRL